MAWAEAGANLSGANGPDAQADALGHVLAFSAIAAAPGPKVGHMAEQVRVANESQRIVEGAVRQAASMRLDAALERGVLSPRQTAQLLGNPGTSPMFAGHLVHNVAARLLRETHGGRFIYYPSRGADILDTVTGMRYEIATVAQAAMKAAKYPGATVTPYRWSPY